MLFMIVIFLILVGLLIGYMAGPLWGDDRPYGLSGDLGISSAVSLVVGLLDWFVIPALGFSQRLTYLGVAVEPAICSFLVLWLLRRKK